MAHVEINNNHRHLAIVCFTTEWSNRLNCTVRLFLKRFTVINYTIEGQEAIVITIPTQLKKITVSCRISRVDTYIGVILFSFRQFKVLVTETINFIWLALAIELNTMIMWNQKLIWIWWSYQRQVLLRLWKLGNLDN